MVERHKQPRYDAQLFILSKREYAGNVPRRRSERFVDLTTVAANELQQTRCPNCLTIWPAHLSLKH